eukprot:9435848-Pyramimonas_sp.AAC.2
MTLPGQASAVEGAALAPTHHDTIIDDPQDVVGREALRVQALARGEPSPVGRGHEKARVLDEGTQRVRIALVRVLVGVLVQEEGQQVPRHAAVVL